MRFTGRIVGLLPIVRQAISRWRSGLMSTLRRGDAAADEGADPVLSFLAQAPIDDEPVTADDERAIVEGWDAHRRGDSMSAADAKRQTLATNQTERVVPA